MRALLQAGAGIGMRDHTGRTALMLAAYTGSLDTVRVLLEAGAEVNPKDAQGETALSLARKGLKRQETLAKFPEPFFEPLADYRIKYEQIIDRLVAAGTKE